MYSKWTPHIYISPKLPFLNKWSHSPICLLHKCIQNFSFPHHSPNASQSITINTSPLSNVKFHVYLLSLSVLLHLFLHNLPSDTQLTLQNRFPVSLRNTQNQTELANFVELMLQRRVTSFKIKSSLVPSLVPNTSQADLN